MSDGYNKGYEKGKSDVEANSDRNMKPPLGEAIVKGKNFTDTYVEGYKDGYRDTKEKRN